MSSREPTWFRAEPFCRQVLHFSFRKIGVIPRATEGDLYRYSAEFREAVRTVGRAVFTLQMIIHHKLRPLFIESINAVANVVNGDVYEEFYNFLSQGYLCHDIFSFTLSSMAIVAELVLFLNNFEVPLPSYFFPMPWCAIYEHRIRNQLEENGGWERLLEEAQKRYIDSNLYSETVLSQINNNQVPHAEWSDMYHFWPVDPLAFLIIRFGVAPRSEALAMRMLRKLYRHEQLIPVPGSGANVIRRMLHIELPEDDWV